jgi:hypothetical protein
LGPKRKRKPRPRAVAKEKKLPTVSKAARDAVADLALLPGVVGVVRGLAKKGGRRTEEPAFIVLVKKKGKAKDDPERLPRHLDEKRERFRLDVIEVGKLSFCKSVRASGEQAPRQVSGRPA